MFAVIENSDLCKFGPEEQAEELFDALYLGGWVRNLKSFLTGKSDTLLDIASFTGGKKVASSHYRGIQKVSINEIKGSEGRSEDFDSAFKPRKNHIRSKWLSVAVAFGRGVGLPPVDLIKIGDVYVVRDGHHRISVAKAFGASSVEARVTEMNVT